MQNKSSPGPAALALFQQGTALAEAGQLADSVQPFVKCLQQAPRFGPGFVNLAYVLHRLGALDQSLVMARTAKELMPQSLEASLVLAAILHEMGDFSGALQVYEHIPSPHRDDAAVLLSQGRTLRALGRLSDALDMHASAIAAAPDNADAHYNYAEALLAAGDFERGWQEYEWRWARSHAPSRGFGPIWAGEDLAGRTILLHAEQGFGDTMQFVRYAPMLATLGCKIILEVQRPLIRLMRSVEGAEQVVGQGDTLPAFDAHCPLLSLPGRFGTAVRTIPANIPYLQADQTLVKLWQALLPADGRRRVGLVWAGSAHRTTSSVALIDRRRSMPLASFAPLGDVAGIRFISLQTGLPAEELQHPPPGLRIEQCLSDEMDFADTAALIETLDLVITMDTAVAHLAGALGCPVWVLSRFDGCWRWLTGRDDSPWYPTLRLYRQTAPSDWAGVIDRIRSDLLQPAPDRPQHRRQHCAA